MAQISLPVVGSTGSGGSAAQPQAEFFTHILSNPNKAEALSWLNEPAEGEAGGTRTLGDIECRDEAVALVRGLYEMGARAVIAAEIHLHAGGQYTSKLVVELPDDPAARARLFAWNAEWSAARGFETDEDLGQRHLFVWVD